MLYKGTYNLQIRAHILVLYGTAACDKKRGVVYLQFAQNSTEGKPEIDLYAVTVRGKDAGKFEIVPRDVSHGQVLRTMKYSVRRDVTGWLHVRREAFKRCPCSESCSDRTNFQILGDIPNVTMRNGPISALNDEAGIFYAMLELSASRAGNDTYVNSTGCAGSCGKNATCCRNPKNKDDKGACFNVRRCSQIPTGGGGPNMSAPFDLTSISLETMQILHHPPLCTLKDGNCPWSLDFSEIQFIFVTKQKNITERLER